MQVEEYLKTYQPVIYQTFVHEFQNDRLSHAYLISGNPGTPLYEVACFLAKSILCDDPSPLACDNCITCMRVDDDNYPDFVVFDGSKATIKKEAVSMIESMFEKEAFEVKGIKIYVLHLIENMTIEATNSLLKFLEEPHPNIYAFLTTNNDMAILPTIVSRCQNFHLKSINRKQVIDEAIALNVSEEDAEFLSYFYNEPNLIYELINDEDRFEYYNGAKNSLFEFLKTLVKNEKEAIFIAQNKVSPMINNKESLRFFIDMLTQVLEDVVNYTNHQHIILKSNKELIDELTEKINKPNEVLLEVLKCRGLINLNVNPSLILDHIVYCLLGEKNGRK